MTGIVDWGDVHRGDPALDLFVMFFLSIEEEKTFMQSYGFIDEDTYKRAMHRAMLYSLILLEYGLLIEDVHFIRMGRRLLSRFLSPITRPLL